MPSGFFDVPLCHGSWPSMMGGRVAAAVSCARLLGLVAAATAVALALGMAPAAGAARLISPTGDAALLTERQLLDDLAPGASIANPLHFELEPGEAGPVGIEVVGMKPGAAPPVPLGRYHYGAFARDSLPLNKPTRDKFYVFRCEPFTTEPGWWTPERRAAISCSSGVMVPATAGRYYWHVRTLRENCTQAINLCWFPWSPAATFVVPAVFRLNGLAVPRRTRPCATGATIRYESNAAQPAAAYTLTVHRPGLRKRLVRVVGTTGNRRGEVSVGKGELEPAPVRVPLDRVPAGRYVARVRLRDDAGHSESARSGPFTVPNPSATCRTPKARAGRTPSPSERKAGS